MDGSATINGDCRFDLVREWLPDHPRMMWLMCNPSTADHRVDDPTIKRCVRFASDHGGGSIEVVNLWPFRATDPSDLWRALERSAISAADLERNVDHICRAAQRATWRVMAFGVAPPARNESYVREIVGLVEHCGPLHALGTNSTGIPLHPLARGKLAIRNGTKLQTWRWPR